MYKRKLYVILIALLSVAGLLYSCDDDSLNHDDVSISDPVPETDEDDGFSAEPTTTSVIKLQLGQENKHQVIDGFGCAFAGWADVTYCHMQRDAILEELFGESGLRFNICRGAIFEHYEDPATGIIDMGMDRNYNVPPDYPPLLKTYKDTTRIGGWYANQTGQMWITDNINRRFKDVMFIYSAWTPPAQWKNNDEMNPEHYPDFANYIVDFVKGYTDRIKSKVYAISPTNEPNFGGQGWGGCKWEEPELGKFIHEYLRPALDKAGFSDVQIILGEHPYWNAGYTYDKNILDSHPEILNDKIIAAGHGYSTQDNTIIPYEAFEKEGVHVWETEVSDDKKYEETWDEAMKWAKTVNTYMSVGNVNAFIWWAGGRYCGPTTGENLLQYQEANHIGSSYYRINRYYTIGHFSRFIPRGSYRMDVQAIPTQKDSIPEELQMSAYVKDSLYTIVLINPSKDKTFTTLLQAEGNEFESMVTYTSDAGNKWLREKRNPSLSGLRYVTVPKFGVVTITGRLRDSLTK